MPDRLADLEARLEGVVRELGEIRRRIDRLEHPDSASRGEAVVGMAAPAGEATTTAAPSRSPLTAGAVGLVGRTLMTLGGAYLFRAVTEMGALPALAGVAGGLAYALGWLFLADRAAARGQRLSAVFHGIASALIVYPLIWETTTRFGLLGSVPAVAGLLEAAANGLLAGSAGPWHGLTVIGVAVGLVAALAYGILARASPPSSTWSTLVPTTGVAALLAFIGAGLAARWLAGALADAPGVSADVAFLATSRTAALAGLALVLAGAGARWGRIELLWLVYPVLAAGGLKLLLEDLPRGRPVSLFVSFALYGGALFATPRLLRGTRLS